MHARARSICQFMIGHVVPSDGAENETHQCLQYEILCWIDCMTAEMIPEFSLILEEAAQLHFKSEIYLLQAWKWADLVQPMPKLAVSPILVAGLSSTSGSSKSNNMVKLLNQVTTKCLFYHDNPLPLAALVGYFHAIKRGVQLEDNLVQYSNSLIAFDSVTESSRKELLFRLVDSIFSERSFYSRILSSIFKVDTKKLSPNSLEGLSQEDNVAATRQLLHILACSSNDELLLRCFSLLRALLPAVLQVCTSLYFQQSLPTMLSLPLLTVFRVTRLLVLF